MSIEWCLQDLAGRARDLLDCGSVSVCLGCPDPALRHPLLNFFPVIHKHAFVEDAARIIGDERIHALCDMAVQIGMQQCIDRSIEWPGMGRPSENLVVAPLERPAGTLGLLFCSDTRQEAFRQGEYQLLQQYVPLLAHQLENMLSDICTPAVSSQTTVATNVQEQSAFISMVGHELRLPLTVIKGYTGLLQAYGIADTQDCMDATQQRQYLNVIMEQANHLEVLIGDLLDVSRIQAGRLTLRRTTVDVTRICQRVAQAVQCQVDQEQPGQYIIRCQADAALPHVWADPDRVQQVLTNLVENAVKYSPAGGLIEIIVHTRRPFYPIVLRPMDEEKLSSSKRAYSLSSWSGRAMIYITIRDHGIGIAPQQQPALFKPFARVEHPATSHVPGAGLGLYISHKLIEAMDGHMTLRSSAGKGTSVTFTLPSIRSAHS